MRLCSTLFSLLIFSSTYAQNIDVQHYRFQLQLSDDNDKVFGKAQIAIKYLQSAKEVAIDLVQQKKDGKGMKVDSVSGRNVASFQQLNNRIVIQFKNTIASNIIDTINVKYSG